MTLSPALATLRARFRQELVRLAARPVAGGPMDACREGSLLAFFPPCGTAYEVTDETVTALAALPNGAGPEAVRHTLTNPTERPGTGVASTDAGRLCGNASEDDRWSNKGRQLDPVGQRNGTVPDAFASERCALHGVASAPGRVSDTLRAFLSPTSARSRAALTGAAPGEPDGPSAPLFSNALGQGASRLTGAGAGSRVSCGGVTTDGSGASAAHLSPMESNT